VQSATTQDAGIYVVDVGVARSGSVEKSKPAKKAKIEVA